MMRYFDKRKKQRLYQQWVDKSGLPPEAVPEELGTQGDLDEPIGEESGEQRWGIQSNFAFRLTMRHLFYLLLAIIALLIATTSLATILIMRSC